MKKIIVFLTFLMLILFLNACGMRQRFPLNYDSFFHVQMKSWIYV